MRKGVNDCEWRSRDSAFGLRMRETVLKRILGFCRRASGLETGGVLIGYYNPKHDSAIITGATDAPRDSVHFRASFHRGIFGLQSLLKRLWTRRREFYIGEWHYHPFGDACASGTDLNQMDRIARDESYACPEPVMLVIGGDPDGKWFAQAYVSEKGKAIQRLHSVSRSSCRGRCGGSA